MKKLQANFARFLIPLACLFAASSAHADDYDYGSRGSVSRRSSRSPFSVSVAGGIGGPSSTGSFGENPAGLIYNERGSLLAYLATGKDHPELLSNGFSFLGGNRQAAASVGVQTYNNATDDGGSITSANFGMATHAEGMNTTFGISGAYRFQSKGRAIDPALQSTWSADFGFLYNPFGDFQFGGQLYELSKGVTAAGMGFASHINSSSKLGLDLSTDNHGRGLTVKPGLGVHAGSMILSYAYGMQVDKTAKSGISPGNTVGLGYEFTPAFRVIGYYNHFSTYYLGGTIDLF